MAFDFSMHKDQKPPGTPPQIPACTIDYWIRSSTAGGRLGLRVRLQAKLWLWKTVLFLTHGLKRVLDIAGSSAALLGASPVFAATALLIKKEDGGPVFFKQMRVGYHGKLFPMWKFRSMVVNADAIKDKLKEQNEMQGGVLFKMKDDPRITRVGKFIRKYSIDELPQFWNVLVGEMSLVGPRPPVPREVAEYSAEDRQRLLAKPGITCLWQVSGRSEIDFAGQVQLDLAYIRSSSVWTDLKLLFLTIPAVLLGKGAY
jgi:exopolysaccharide biosynthesis polyprenyl glycosylphosphotransferase